MSGQWLMLAFKPADGYTQAKSGKSWFKLVATREEAILAKRELVAQKIPYAVKKVELGDRRPTRRPSRAERDSAYGFWDPC